ncbi:hypothetical protein CR513_21758, partial [Mucuna pruriens]
MDRSMIDAASGGALMDKTPAAARHLISNMVSNTHQLGIRGPSQSRMVNEIGAASNLRLENQFSELTSLVRQLVIGYQYGKLPTVKSAISSTAFPTAAVVENATARQFSISRGPDEATYS